jgi:hypothetical protein
MAFSAHRPHRRDHVELSKAGNVGGQQMLGMLDAVPPRLHVWQRCVDVEQLVVGLITNRVHGELHALVMRPLQIGRELLQVRRLP